MLKCWLLTVAILLVLNHAHSQTCPDRRALQNVTAYWKNLNDENKGEYDDSINFYILENHTLIHIVKANVSVLCDGMVKNFFRLKYLALTDANISKILPEAFQQVPRLTSLSLAVNHLTSLKKDQFKNLQQLKFLYLSSNLIEDIEKDTFDELVNLEKIYLDKNKISEIESQWFLNNFQISLINMAFNKISKLQSAAFTLPKNSAVEIRLQHNDIEEIEERAVIPGGTDEEEPYLTLHLDHNDLKEIPSAFIKSMDNLHSSLYFNNNSITCISSETLNTLKNSAVYLHLVNNPLNCSCISNIKKFLKENQMRVPFYYNSTNDCYLYDLQVPNEWNETDRY
ncbi:LRR 8 domain containing protein [Asbolus verrucosus]|uniref:LRR 8 domain containing protein n=1 Tax=Asbolus verrucosus TaxID=1661398 RepID=A0A482VA80_ASBVE|nr:LRR 8 domain containing protein [Asbolus verrucosus]